MGRLHHSLVSGPARAVAIVSFVVCGFAVAPAQAALIDFQDQPLGPYPGDIVTLTTQGVSVTFSGMDLMIRDIVQPHGRPPGASRVMWTYITYDAITATFEGGFTTDFVQIRNWIAGVYSPEVDTITMSAFDPSNALLGTVVSSGEFISLAFPDIAKVVFDDVDTGYLIDEFQFNVTVPEPVPEPASLTLLALGVLVTVLLGNGRLSGA